MRLIVWGLACCASISLAIICGIAALLVWMGVPDTTGWGAVFATIYGLLLILAALSILISALSRLREIVAEGRGIEPRRV